VSHDLLRRAQKWRIAVKYCENSTDMSIISIDKLEMMLDLQSPFHLGNQLLTRPAADHPALSDLES
jgi:hypothetical protein